MWGQYCPTYHHWRGVVTTAPPIIRRCDQCFPTHHWEVGSMPPRPLPLEATPHPQELGSMPPRPSPLERCGQHCPAHPHRHWKSRLITRRCGQYCPTHHQEVCSAIHHWEVWSMPCHPHPSPQEAMPHHQEVWSALPHPSPEGVVSTAPPITRRCGQHCPTFQEGLG